MVLPIRKYGDPVLRQVCKPVHRITAEIITLSEDMLETMYASNLRGLAAPQVGCLLHMIVIDVRLSRHPSKLEMDGRSVALDSLLPLVLLNTVVTPGTNLQTMSETCGSLPGIRAELERPESAEVSGLFLSGKHIHFRSEGFLARAIAHELDHLNGILFTDRMSPEVLATFQAQLTALEHETTRSSPTSR